MRCNERPQSVHTNRGGVVKYKPICDRCADILYRGKGYMDVKSDTCAKCGFVAVHTCQMDVDHIDGNKSNIDPTNLQTLCSNCHRLKTFINKEWNNRSKGV